jgi:hypothetical protein
MTNRAHVWRGALGTVAIGLMAAALTAGCGGDGGDGGAASRTTAPHEPVATDAQRAVITPLGVTTTGCELTASFGITSPTTIDFVAFHRAASGASLSNIQSQLDDVDDQGVTTQVHQAAQQAGSAMVYDNLSYLSSHHLILQITATSSQANAALRVYQGSNGQVTAQSELQQSLPGCGIGFSGPVVTPVVIHLVAPTRVATPE